MKPLLHKCLSVIAGFVLLCAALPMNYARADTVPEYTLKAAFIYNFATFTEWPGRNAETLDLCILGSNPFGDALKTIEGKLVGNARLVTRHVTVSDSTLRNCQIMFISTSEKDRLPGILDLAREYSILSVADFQNAARQGVMIELAMEQKKITFEINLEAAKRARLNLSSKLLRLAKTVY